MKKWKKFKKQNAIQINLLYSIFSFTTFSCKKLWKEHVNYQFLSIFIIILLIYLYIIIFIILGKIKFDVSYKKNNDKTIEYGDRKMNSLFETRETTYEFSNNEQNESELKSCCETKWLSVHELTRIGTKEIK